MFIFISNELPLFVAVFGQNVWYLYRIQCISWWHYFKRLSFIPISKCNPFHLWFVTKTIHFKNPRKICISVHSDDIGCGYLGGIPMINDWLISFRSIFQDNRNRWNFLTFWENSKMHVISLNYTHVSVFLYRQLKFYRDQNLIFCYIVSDCSF